MRAPNLVQGTQGLELSTWGVAAGGLDFMGSCGHIVQAVDLSCDSKKGAGTCCKADDP